MLERLKAILAKEDPLPHGQVLPTVGLNLQRLSALGVNLVFWDLGGQAGLRTIWEKYFREAHAIMFVVDSVDQERFGDAADALRRALGHKDLAGAPCLVIANKQDLSDATTQNEVMRALGVDKADYPERPCRVIAASGTKGDGVREAVAWLVESIKRSDRAKRFA